MLSDSAAKILVLGTAQDGGYPQTGCKNECCIDVWKMPKLKRLVSSLAIISSENYWLIDMSPDFNQQLQFAESHLNEEQNISGIFLSHAHMGHYIGILELGLEVMNAKEIPVYVMPRMKRFLEKNAPFTQLINLKNIKLILMKENSSIQLNHEIRIVPFQVPHRNEFSETVGYKIHSSNKSLIYISDIDSWEQWDIDINELIMNNNYLLLDGTFYNKIELSDRSMKEIPHPFIEESMNKFSLLDKVDRKKVYFTHLNHTNPVIKNTTPQKKILTKQGYNVAEDKMIFLI